eukprot:Awhi_evm1s11473
MYIFTCCMKPQESYVDKFESKDPVQPPLEELHQSFLNSIHQMNSGIKSKSKSFQEIYTPMPAIHSNSGYLRFCQTPKDCGFASR